MFPVVFFSLISMFVSLIAVISGLWDHDLLQIKLGSLALFGWVVASGLSIVFAAKKDK